MTDKEARKVITILLKADGGCAICVTELLTAFATDFPTYRIHCANAYKREFNKKLTLPKLSF